MEKFKAWDKIKKEWIPEPFVLHVNGTICLIRESGNFGYLGSSVEVVYSTGLKDKNDVEIFEGDVVDWDEGHWNDCTGIDWDNAAVQAGCAPHDHSVEVVVFVNGQFTPVCWADDDESTRPPLSQCEVIGNVHENPELIP